MSSLLFRTIERIYPEILEYRTKILQRLSTIGRLQLDSGMLSQWEWEIV